MRYNTQTTEVRQHIAFALLCGGYSVGQIALTLRCARKTIHQYLHNDVKRLLAYLNSLPGYGCPVNTTKGITALFRAYKLRVLCEVLGCTHAYASRLIGIHHSRARYYLSLPTEMVKDFALVGITIQLTGNLRELNGNYEVTPGQYVVCDYSPVQQSTIRLVSMDGQKSWVVRAEDLRGLAVPIDKPKEIDLDRVRTIAKHKTRSTDSLSSPVKPAERVEHTHPVERAQGQT